MVHLKPRRDRPRLFDIDCLEGFGGAWLSDQCGGLAEIGVIFDLLDEKIGDV